MNTKGCEQTQGRRVPRRDCNYSDGVSCVMDLLRRRVRAERQTIKPYNLSTWFGNNTHYSSKSERNDGKHNISNIASRESALFIPCTACQCKSPKEVRGFPRNAPPKADAHPTSYRGSSNPKVATSSSDESTLFPFADQIQTHLARISNQREH